MTSIRRQARQPTRVRAVLPWLLAAAWCGLAVAGAARITALEARADKLANQQAGYDKWLREQEAILSDFQRQLDRVPKPILPPVGDWPGVVR